MMNSFQSYFSFLVIFLLLHDCILLIHGTIMTKVYVQDNDALCLDGSKASYYIHYSPFNSSKWIFYAEDGGANCILSEKLCQKLIDTVPYFITSSDKHHPPEREAFTIFSDDPLSGPWPDANFIFMNYCSQDGWLGSGFYLRGSIIFKGILSQVLKDQDPTVTELVIVGSSAGTIGVFNHIQWIVNSLHYSVENVQMILDSFYAPVTHVTPMEDLIINLPYITNYTAQSMTYWVDGFPCAVVFECMVSTGFIPSGIKSLIISSAWDGIVYAYGTSGAASVDMGKSFEDISEFVAGYVAFAGSVVESAVNMHYNKHFANTTVFIAGCIHHLYIMPFDPVYRFVEVSDSDEKVARRVDRSTGMWSDSAKFGSLATLEGSGGPFRWDTVNFAGSQEHTGARTSPPQYATPSTLGEMVRIWSKSTTLPDIAGDLCATSPQCGDYCNHEEILAFVIPLRHQLYQALNGLSAFLLFVVISAIIYVVSTDSVHQTTPDSDFLIGIEANNQTFAEIYLAQKKAQRDLEEIERIKSLEEDHRGGNDEFEQDLTSSVEVGTELSKFETPTKTLTRIKREYSIRRASRDSYESDHVRSAREDVANVVGAHFGGVEYETGEAQNLKMMSLLKSWKVMGNDALLWHGVVYKTDVEDSTPILNKIWGAMKYGKVTAIMGPSGCGKSTLLKVLGGQVKSGYFEGTYRKHILLRGLELVSEKKGAIGFVRQHGAGTVIPSLTVYENLFYRTCLFASKRDTSDDIHKTCTSLLVRCGLEHRKNVKVTSLSGGQQKRFSIHIFPPPSHVLVDWLSGWKSLRRNDSVLFMDEPTSGLDSSSSLEVMTLIKNEALLHGKCVALVIHQPRNEIFNLLDDLLLLKEGHTLYYGGVSWFRENIVPQLAESAFDSIGDRIIDHITSYDDLFVPSDADTSNLFRSDILKREFLTSIGQSGLKREPSPTYIANAQPFQHKKLSTIIDQFYANLTDDTSSAFIDENIPPNNFMMDAKHKPNSTELLQQLNTILAKYGNDQRPISLQYSDAEKLNYYHRLTKFIAKVIVNVRRLFLTFNYSAIIFNFLLAVSLYPIMSLLLLHGLKANDLFLGICFIVFFPFLFVTVACASTMADVYRVLIIDVEDGIYSALSLQTALMIYFIFSSLVICITSLGAIFVVRPETVWMELYEGLMILNLDMIFFIGMIYFCVVACAGDPGLVFRNVTILLTFCTLFGGLLINIYKFPDFIKFVLQVNPLFISAATNQYIFIDSCTLLYGDDNFCRSFMMTAFGYYPYSEPGLGNGIILAWGIFFNLLAWVVLIFQQSASGVYINDADDDEGMLNRFLSTMSLRSLSSHGSSFKGLNQTVGLGSPSPNIGAKEGSVRMPTSEKSFSNLKVLPRMIQQKSQLLGEEDDGDDSSSVASMTDTRRVKSMQYHSLAITHDDDIDNPAETPLQLRKVQSMFTSLPKSKQESGVHRSQREPDIVVSSNISLVEMNGDRQASPHLPENDDLESFLEQNGTQVEDVEIQEVLTPVIGDSQDLSSQQSPPSLSPNQPDGNLPRPYPYTEQETEPLP